MIKTTKGFTLAEVLTTLMVIGVVAAMTIPTLLNSTNDQQFKTAYRKAMSVLSQGIQLMVAKEDQCNVTNDATLAECFQNVISGSRVNAEGQIDNGENAVTNNVILTNDGMAYAFYFNGTAAENGATKTIDEICGSGFDATEDHEYEYGKCFVAVDLNGLGKGGKKFNTAGAALNYQANKTAGSLLGDTKNSDQEVMIISGAGVRPVFNKDGDLNSGVNKGYAYMYGTDATPYKEAAAQQQGGGEQQGGGN